MTEDDKSRLIRSLHILKFNVENLDINKINYVPIHQYKIATKEHPLLYVDGLQCCIGLYAYCTNFAFASHINPKIIRNNDFDLDINNLPISCKKINDLKKCIFENTPFLELLKIGIAFGVTPLSKDYTTMQIIYNNIDKLISELNLMGIESKLLDDIYAPEFILDSENQRIILGDVAKKELKNFKHY